MPQWRWPGRSGRDFSSCLFYDLAQRRVSLRIDRPGGLFFMAQEIDALLQETREFPPSDEFREQANANDPAIWAKAKSDREGFWAEWAGQLDWQTKWDRVLEWNPPDAKWFVGG